MIDTSNFTPAQLAAYNTILADVALWAQTFLRDPDKPDHPPIRLNYVQRRIFEPNKMLNVIRVHRRAGKSFALCIYAIWYALTHESAQVLIICPDREKVLNLFNLLDEFIRVSPGLEDLLMEKTKSPALRKFANGSTITGYTTGARSNSKGAAIRGNTADVVIVDEAAYLGEDDWQAVTPIMQGDAQRMGKIVCFIASTPTDKRGVYYTWSTSDYSHLPSELQWNQVHVPVTENPDYDDKAVAAARALCENEETWKQEWLALFPDIGEGVFKRSYIDRAQRDFEYYDITANQNAIPQGIVRTMGVDWDKYGGAGPNIVCLELDYEKQLYRICYREEILPSEFCLTLGVNRIIALNDILRPAYIYVDRGFGEAQCEMLHLEGQKNPASGLATKVVGKSFSDVVEVPDPVTGQIHKKPIKPFMVNILTRWFEENELIYPSRDAKLTVQLQDFSVVRTTDRTITYTSDNEHIIDALCLAALAMHENFTNPFTFEAATYGYLLPVPEPVPERDAGVDAYGERTAYGVVLDDLLKSRGFSRRRLPAAASGGRDFGRDERTPKVAMPSGPRPNPFTRKGF